MYFETVPIREQREAKVLASGSGWEIIDLLRGRGVVGCTAEEISEELDLPVSTVYDTLSKLRAAGFVEVRRYRPRLGRPDKDAREEEERTGKQKKIYTEHIRWGGSTFYIEFDRFLVEEIDNIIDKSDIVEQCANLVNDIISKMKQTKAGRNFLPLPDECPHCHFSHDTKEFTYALIAAIADRIKKNNKIDKILEEHGYYI